MKSLFYRLRWLLFRSTKEAELREELQFHLEEEAEERQSNGLPQKEAHWAARRELGNLTLVEENTRAVWIPVFLEQIVQDMRYGLRALFEHPGFAVVAVMTLALGIGINAAVFTVTNAVLFKGFSFVERNDRLLYLTTNRYCCVSYPDFEDWRAQSKSFEDMAIVRGMKRILSDKTGFSENYDATEVSANTFHLVGQRPMLGRDFTHSDEIPGATPVTILTYPFWEQRYGKNPAIVGQAIRMNGVPTTVIGVMPRGFSFPQKQDLWVPLVPTADLRKREIRDTWFVVGRMADGVTIENVRAEMKALGKRLEAIYPDTNRDFLPEVRSFREFFMGENDTVIYGSLWGAVGLVLLIACANLANLLLARAIGRSREISVRIALGAGRWRIMRQLFVESMMLASAGALLGWWIARSAVRLYELAPPNSSWRVLDYSMDYHVLVYLVAISIGTALLFGLAPASRLAQLDVNSALKDGGRSATGGGHAKRLSTLVVIGEIAVAIILLAGAGLMIRSFLNIHNADVGVKPENILAMWLSPDAKYSTTEMQISFFDHLKTRLQVIPGVESVAIANCLPLQRSLKFPYELTGAAPAEDQRRPQLSAVVIGPGYFRTLQANVLSGREFNDFDGVSGIPTVIVNQAFATKYWPGENPLGKGLRIFDGKTPRSWLKVIGVVSNIAQNGSTQQEFDPLIYLLYRQKPPHSGTVPATFMYVIARTGVAPVNLEQAFRREVQAIDPDLPIWTLATLTELFEFGYRPSSINAALFVIFAVIALLLASLGLYAVVAHSISQRTQEIGIRRALGGTASDIFKLVFMQGMLPAGIGLGIGLIASLGLNRILQSQLVEVSPSDPVTLLIASAALILSATLGCLVPAHRAMRVDPVVALRHE